MNRYQVRWADDALADLAKLCLVYASRAAVTNAVNEIDRLLEHGSREGFQHVAEGLHKLTVEPVTAYFAINDREHRIEVFNIGLRSL